MIVYSYSEAEQQLSVLLETALRQGQVKLRNQNGQIFIISPEKPQKSSAFDIESLQVSISKSDILEAIRESRERFESLHNEPDLRMMMNTSGVFLDDELESINE